MEKDFTPGYNLPRKSQGATVLKALRWVLVLCGIALFAYSFRLQAVKDATAAPSAAGMVGYKCAYLALTIPWGSGGLQLLHSSPLQYFSILFSGWINPLFAIAFFFALFKPRARASLVLSVIVTVMFVFCWIFFWQLHLRVLPGYWFWMGGILLSLYANWLASARRIPGKLTAP